MASATAASIRRVISSGSKSKTAGRREPAVRLKNATPLPRPRAAAPSIAALVHARRLQAGDLILYLQLATLQFRDRHIVDGRVRQSVGELALQRLMLAFQFRKMRLDGHRWSLLVSDF